MQTAIIGIFLTLLGGIMIAFGWALQREAYNDIEGTKESILKRPRWWCGLILVIVAQPFFIAGVSFANQSTICIVGPFALIANIAFARLYLKEKVTKLEYIAICCFILGAILTLSYASKENNKYSVGQFYAIFISAPSPLYLILNIVVIGLALFTSKKIVKQFSLSDSNLKQKHSSENDINIEMGEEVKTSDPNNNSYKSSSLNKKLKSNDSDTLETTKTDHESDKLMQTNLMFNSSRWRIVPLITYPYSACFFSSLTITFVKALSGFAITDKESGRSFLIKMFIVYLLLIIICGLLSFWLKNKSLKHFHTIYCVPLFKAGDIYHNLLSGGIFLREFGEYNTSDLILFLIGIIICISSISLLLYSSHRKLKEEKN